MLRQLPRLLGTTLAALLLCAACESPCDSLVEKRCACGPQACEEARNEMKLEAELLKSLGGGRGGKKQLSERCEARLASVSCAPSP